MLINNLKILDEICVKIKVSKLESIGLNQRIFLTVILKDNSSLKIKELLINGNKRKYSYHWQDNNNNLICRWDNSPHWKSILSFPHHKHYKNKILESYFVESEAIFKELLKMYYRKE